MDVLNRSIAKTNIWIKDSKKALGWSDDRKAYTALCAVLHAIRDHLTNQEAVEFAAQLPTFIRGSFYEGWKLKDKPSGSRTQYGFLSAIQKPFGKNNNARVDSRHVASAILNLLNDKISQGEIDDIRAILPKQIREFWPLPVKSKIIKFPPVRRASSRKRPEHTVRELLQSANKGNRAVTGLASTLQAMNQGRAWRILYDSKVPLHGYACSICGAMFAADREQCSFCGSALHEVDNMTMHILEFAADHAIETTEVVGLESKHLTQSAGGIGAFLRSSRAVREGLA